MKWLLRRAWNGLAAVSLLLCVAACALWVRSYWVGDECYLPLGGDDQPGHAAQMYDLAFGRGGVLFAHDWCDVPKFYTATRGPGLRVEQSLAPFYPHVFYFDSPSKTPLGFGFRSGIEKWSEPPWTFDLFEVVMPLWFVALVFGLLPAFRLLRILRRPRTRRPGLCRSCAYDLTGNQSGVCPECGRDVVKGAAASRGTKRPVADTRSA